MSTKYNIPLLEYLTSRASSYKGTGTNADGLNFEAQLEIRSRVSENLIELAFQAKDEDSAFHDEVTWITTDLLRDQVALWTVSTNTPGVLQHTLFQDQDDEIRERRLIFRLGSPDDTHSFRQEISLSFMRDGSVEYSYGWGVPHEKFATRIRTVLHMRSN